MMANITALQFQRLLLKWFDSHGRKELPWQINKTPYRVWISEIMLQQTQVATVIPYYLRFMQRFPDAIALASAEEDEVLHLWAGLGYYSRARNLHRAAKLIIHDFDGIFPDSLESMTSLPGIGPSTAGAILSIAFSQPTPILDGNVKRVLSRLHAIKKPLTDKTVEARLWQLAEQYTPKERVADYTQAIMDLGATLCTRSKPACETCPMVKYCAAYHQGIASDLPMRKTGRELPVKSATFLIMRKNKRVLLEKRPSTGIWGGLWSLPEITGEAGKKAIREACRANYQATVTHIEPLASFRHTFSHYHLDITPVVVEIGSMPLKGMEADRQIWYNPRQPEAVGLPKPIQTIMSALR